MTGDDDVAEVFRLRQQELVESLHVRLVHRCDSVIEVNDGVLRVLLFLKREEKAKPQCVEVRLGQTGHR